MAYEDGRTNRRILRHQQEKIAAAIEAGWQEFLRTVLSDAVLSRDVAAKLKATWVHGFVTGGQFEIDQSKETIADDN